MLVISVNKEMTGGLDLWTSSLWGKWIRFNAMLVDQAHISLIFRIVELMLVEDD